jgi:hypothetical protein
MNFKSTIQHNAVSSVKFRLNTVESWHTASSSQRVASWVVMVVCIACNNMAGCAMAHGL